MQPETAMSGRVRGVKGKEKSPSPLRRPDWEKENLYPTFAQTADMRWQTVLSINAARVF